MQKLINRIEEDFASSPVDGCCVLSIDDWQTLKSAVLAQQTSNSQSDAIALASHAFDIAIELGHSAILIGVLRRLNTVLAQQQ